MKHVSILALALLVFSQMVDAKSNPEFYYGEALNQMIEETPPRGENQTKLIHEIQRVLRSTHSVKPGAMDVISDTCESSTCVKHKAIGYNQARRVLLGDMYLVEKEGHYAISEFYCEREYLDSEFPSSQAPAPNQIPDDKVVNIEHTWPQSRFNSRFAKEEQKSDLHHLYPTDSQMNSVRGNFEFGEVGKDLKDLKCDGLRFGQDEVASGPAAPVFEPPEDHKGRVARALFYFSIKYELPIGAREEAHLREWHKSHPVAADEEARNQRVFEIQGSRNPFVDFPELADKIQDF